MKNQRDFWRSPDSWIIISCLLAFVGMIVMLIGAVRQEDTLKTVALFLMSPFAVVTAIVALVFIPLILYASWKNKRSGPR